MFPLLKFVLVVIDPTGSRHRRPFPKEEKQRRLRLPGQEYAYLKAAAGYLIGS
jgi:hypothetical protein